jgi:hypothetical protein
MFIHLVAVEPETYTLEMAASLRQPTRTNANGSALAMTMMDATRLVVAALPISPQPMSLLSNITPTSPRSTYPLAAVGLVISFMKDLLLVLPLPLNEHISTSRN